LIDFHCHLDLYLDPSRVAEEAADAGIGVLSVTTTPSAWPGTSALAQTLPFVRTALGLHPQLAVERRRELDLFNDYLPQARFVGEVGLDGSREHRAGLATQVQVFDSILASCARASGRVLSVHSRGAARDVLDALRRHPDSGTWVLHWFSGSVADLRRAIDMGCWFSVGPAMLRGAKGRMLLGLMPRDRVVLESDGPFAVSDTGSPLEPRQIESALDPTSSVWTVPTDELCDMIRANTSQLVNLS